MSYITKGKAVLFLSLALALAVTVWASPAGAVTIDELLAQIAQLQAQLLQLQGGAGAGAGATACSFTRSLYLGVSGADVKCLQQYLNGAGYTVAATGVGSAGNETMYYGGLTKAAVAKWQAANGVAPAVGYFGSISQAKYSAVAGTTGGTTGGGVVTPPAAGGLSVGLASDTPAARTIVAGAANMSFGKWSFTAGSGEVTVTTMKFTRSGISSDAELGSGYLYDADSGEYIAQYTGLGSGVLSFTNSSGLFKVAAGATKRVELRVDVASGASNNHTMAWGLNAAADVVSNATSVSGTFPSSSNAMTFVTVTDPTIATLTRVVITTGSSVNAGTTGYLAGSFTLASANSAVLLDRIVLTQNGSLLSATDLANIKLVTTGGQQLGQVLPALGSDGKGTFVMSPAYEVPAGQTIQVNVYADVLGGVNRTLILNVLNLRDIHARDKTYNVGVNVSGTITMTTTTIAAGTLTITLNPSSPTGNIALGQTNLTVAKFKVTSYGEQVKVLYVPFRIVMTGAADDMTTEIDNIYLVDDAGNQIGSTITAPSANTDTTGTWDDTETTNPDATFGTSSSNLNYLIPANTTRVWSLRLDLLTTSTATDLAANLQAGTDNYQGQISLVSTGDTTAVTANTLTIASNVFQVKQNTAVGAGNLVKGQSGARIGSFVMSASSAEGINVSTLTLTSSTTFPFANLMVKINGVQFGDIKGSTAASTAYTFSGSSPALIAAGSSITVDVYADILSTATNVGSYWYIDVQGASAVGATTATSQTLKNTAGTTISSSVVVKGQNYTINVTGGTLTITVDSASPAAYQSVMGKTSQTLGIFRFAGSSVSDTNITDLTVFNISTSTGDPTNAKSNFSNLQWYKGGVAVAPVIISGTASTENALNSLVTYGYKYAFHFTSPIVVPQNGNASLELRGDVADFASGGAQSNSTNNFRIESPADVTALSSGGSLAVGVSGPDHTSGIQAATITVLRTKLTVTAPTGLVTTTNHPRSADDVIAYFDFTADPANSVIINTVSLKRAGATLPTLTIILIDADTGSAWGSTPAAGQIIADPDSVFEADVSTSGTSTVIFRPAYTLSSGATKRVKVKADTSTLTATSGSTNGSVLQLYLGNTTKGEATTPSGVISCEHPDSLCNALGWNDGTSGSINLEAKGLPIYAPSIGY